MITYKLYNGQEEVDFYPDSHLYIWNDRIMDGVTSILNVINKPSLLQWASNEAVDHLSKNPKDFKGARVKFKSISDNALEIGTDTHSLLEKFIKTGEITDDPIAKLGINWIRKNKVEIIECERVVLSRKHRYVGTTDFICKINDKVYLGDFKTSKRIYPEYFLQTAAYQLAYQEEFPDFKIDGNIIVRTGKDKKLDVQFNTEFTKNKKAFLAALELHRWME